MNETKTVTEFGLGVIRDQLITMCEMKNLKNCFLEKRQNFFRKLKRFLDIGLCKCIFMLWEHLDVTSRISFIISEIISQISVGKRFL